MTTTAAAEWMKNQKLVAPSMKNDMTFYRNLEESLDVRRRDHALFTIKTNVWRNGDAVDLSSNDTLSLGANGHLRKEFDREMARFPDASIGAGSSRIMDGNYEYLEEVEREIAQFHGAETGLILASGFEANMALFSAIPRAGDAIVYDELVHASTHDGMHASQASYRIPFRHNSADSFRDALTTVDDSQPQVRNGKRCVVVAVEAFYSMDGDVCPLKELVEVAKELFPNGNAQFIVDEAHSTGVVGPQGRGLVCELGLESEISIRLHTFGKALGSSGAIVLGNKTIKAALANLARAVVFTTAPTFPAVAAARSAYSLMRTGQTKAAQENVQVVVKYFFRTITSNVVIQNAMKSGVLRVPLSLDWEEQPFVTHIVPIWTRPMYSYWLTFHLIMRKICAWPVEYPAVPKGQGRVRLAFHANNTTSEIDQLTSAIVEWAEEMTNIERDQTSTGTKMPKAARQVYASIRDDNVDSS